MQEVKWAKDLAAVAAAGPHCGKPSPLHLWAGRMRGRIAAAVLAFTLCIGSASAQYGDNGFVNAPTNSTWSSEPIAAQQRWAQLIKWVPPGGAMTCV